jgi:glucokinase
VGIVANLATGIILVAGTSTFANEWYQTGKVNWRVPVATLLLAAGFDALAHIDDKAAVGLSIVVLIGAATTRFGGKSTADTLAELFSNKPQGKQRKKQHRPLKVA